MSTSSHHRESSQASSSGRPPPPAVIIVTTPPWAVEDEDTPVNEVVRGSESRTSAARSRISSISGNPSRWWVFNDPHNRIAKPVEGLPPSSPQSERRGLRDISLGWIPSSVVRMNTGSFTRKGKDMNISPQSTTSKESGQTYTTSHTLTPCLRTPWTANPEAPGPSPSRQPERNDLCESDDRPSREENNGLRKNTLRSFMLTNVYIPLLFRFVNISFTTTALALSIRIRNLELKNNILGSVGSSPTVVIIFSPPTLVHVLVAIYLEYFGRPLGLWRTSAKLAHTLIEVLFICLWSAALSIAFDNFFTSLIPCTLPSAVSWYNQLPRPASTIPISEEALGNKICDYQLSLIFFVGFGLVAYCSNLIISLYRIFEKVKYHAVPPLGYQP